MEITFDENNKYYNAINEVLDPELGIGLAEMGLIYEVKEHDDVLDVKMTLTYMGCPLGPQMVDDLEYALKKQPGINVVNIEIVWEPAWTLDRIKPEVREMLYGNRGFGNGTDAI